MKVKVLENYRLAHAGEIFAPGDIADVADRVAKDWIRQGWAEAVEDKPTKAAPRKRSG
jgi:hypothetical protein